MLHLSYLYRKLASNMEPETFIQMAQSVFINVRI